jgi:ubiquitin C-terminal hydrolase
LSLDLRSQVETQVKKAQQQKKQGKKMTGANGTVLSGQQPDPSDARLSIHDCLRNYTSPEVMDGYNCPQCKERGVKNKEGATKRLSVNKLPQSLCIQLKVPSTLLHLNISPPRE